MVYTFNQKVSMQDLMKLNVLYGHRELEALVNNLEYLVHNGVVIHNKEHGFMYRLLSYSYCDNYMDFSREFSFEIDVISGASPEDMKGIEDFCLIEVI